MPSQTHKHVTHNEAIRPLDAMVRLAVLDRDQTEPPAEPTEGDRHIVATGATGLWTGRPGGGPAGRGMNLSCTSGGLARCGHWRTDHDVVRRDELEHRI
ncbi:DUF2793 domain-containing protein [Pelagibacterium sediminicola]|uniref:DUF2793 domain-containing protein n=1 Tax=Pelagibacterium sediminicola TaxID=2248761 RepID=UPI000E321C83